MHTNFLNLPQDIQFTIFCLLNKEELISTIPLVCHDFKNLSKDEIIWNNLRIKRQNVQMVLNFPLQYTNQIAIRHLKLNDLEDFQKIKDLSPFEQRSRILDLLARKIQEHPNSKGESPIGLVCSKINNKWIESTNNPNSKIVEDPSSFSKEEAIEIRNKICPERNLKLLPEIQTLISLVNKGEFVLGFPLESILQDEQKAIFELPLRLNDMANTNDIGSVLQTLLCIDCVREQFKHGKLATNEEIQLADLKKKIAVEQEILQFVPEFSENGMLSRQELISFLLKDPSLLRLKKAIFNSGMLKMNEPNDPIDVSQLMEYFIHAFLPHCQFELERHATTADFPGYEFITNERINLLPISLRNQRKYQSLQMLIRCTVL